MDIKIINDYCQGNAECFDFYIDGDFFTSRIYRYWPNSTSHTFVVSGSRNLTEDESIELQKYYGYNSYNNDFRNYQKESNAITSWSCLR